MDRKATTFQRHHGGAPVVTRMLYALSIIIDGCEKHPEDPELQTLGTRAKDIHKKLQDAHQNKLHHQAELKKANWELHTLVPETTDRYYELRGFLHSKYGIRSSQLAEFGVAPKRHRARKQNTADSTGSHEGGAGSESAE
jgi:hypothetical protein